MNLNIHLLNGLEEFYLCDMEWWPNFYIQDQNLLAVLYQPDKSAFFKLLLGYISSLFYSNNR